MQNAIGRNRHVQIARSTQSRLLKDFKESQNSVYEDVLDKSKSSSEFIYYNYNVCLLGELDIESIERVPDAVADQRILGKFKEM